MPKKYKRKIFYLGGFDPRGSRYYYKLYKSELGKYSEISGVDVEVEGTPKATDYELSWNIKNKTEKIEIDYTFLKWEDIIKDYWERNPIKIFLQALKTYFYILFFARWGKIFTLPLNPIITLAYPILTPISLILLNFLIIFWVVFGNINWLGMAVLILSAMFLFHIIISKIKSLWLLRFYNFNFSVFNNEDIKLNQRLSIFADLISKDLKSGEYSDVTFVSHSNGSILALPTMNKIAKNLNGKIPSNFKLLTLGQCTPLALCYGKAEKFHNDLKEISEVSFNWEDISYPPDGACYPKTNPFELMELEHKVKFSSISPQFFKYYDSNKYKKILKNKFLLHFQYIICADKISDKNYFKISTQKGL